MQNPELEHRLLSVPAVERVNYPRNLIRFAVCELRFPTVFELEGGRPPNDFWSAIRKEFPNWDLVKDLNVSAVGVAHASGHQFHDKKRRWSITLRPSSVSIETSKYDTFSNFLERIRLVLKAARKTIDSDFFTRIGIRYVNGISDPDISGWINPDLTKLLLSGIYGTVDEYTERVRGATAIGGYNFQHGVSNHPQTGAREYQLDFDFFKEDVPYDKAIDTISELRKLQYSMFIWALGPKAKSYMDASSSGESK